MSNAFDAARARPSSIELPPPVQFPVSSTYVFTSRRSTRAHPPTPPSAHPPATPSSPGDSPGGPDAPRRRPSAGLSDDQRHRHSHGSLDMRAALMHGKTPAGFIHFPAGSPPAAPAPAGRHSASDHPSYFPPQRPPLTEDERLFFPPVALVNVKAVSAASEEAHTSPSWMRARPEVGTSAGWLGEDERMSLRAVEASTKFVLSQAALGGCGGFVQATEVRVNTQTNKPRRHSIAAVTDGPAAHELSLSELIVGVRPGGSASSLPQNPQRESSETAVEEDKRAARKTKSDLGKKKKSRRLPNIREDEDSSDSDWGAPTIASMDDFRERLPKIQVSRPEAKYTTSTPHNRYVAQRTSEKKIVRSKLLPTKHSEKITSRRAPETKLD